MRTLGPQSKPRSFTLILSLGFFMFRRKEMAYFKGGRKGYVLTSNGLVLPQRSTPPSSLPVLSSGSVCESAL